MAICKSRKRQSVPGPAPGTDPGSPAPSCPAPGASGPDSPGPDSPGPAGARLGWLDALRGFAALTVVWFHLSPVVLGPERHLRIHHHIDLGKYGVLLFFLVSFPASHLFRTLERRLAPTR